MKKAMGKPFCRFLALWLLIAAGMPFVPAGKPKVLDTGPYPRVAVWVCRMADQNGLLPDIKPETDYALRTPTGLKLGQVSTGFNPMAVVVNDPAVREDPAMKQKIKVIDPADTDYAFERGFLISERRNLFSRATTVTVITLGDDEVRQRALVYLRKGFHGPQKLWDFPGVEELIK